jgi:hypothetical protein
VSSIPDTHAISTDIHAMPSSLTRIQQTRLEYTIQKLVAKYPVSDLYIALITGIIRKQQRAFTERDARLLGEFIRLSAQLVFSNQFDNLTKAGL